MTSVQEDISTGQESLVQCTIEADQLEAEVLRLKREREELRKQFEQRYLLRPLPVAWRFSSDAPFLFEQSMRAP